MKIKPIESNVPDADYKSFYEAFRFICKLPTIDLNDRMLYLMIVSWHVHHLGCDHNDEYFASVLNLDTDVIQTSIDNLVSLGLIMSNCTVSKKGIVISRILIPMIAIR